MSSKAGIYIHIPLCKKKCIYCDFYSFTLPGAFGKRISSTRSSAVSANSFTNIFITTLKKEMQFRKDVFSSFDTIYLGGGTPSVVSGKNLQSLFNGIFESFSGKLAGNPEITLEANPADITREKLETWKSLGVNRLSIGIQSLDDEMLRFLGRRHNAKKAIESLGAATAGGFKHVSCDLLLGLPILSKKSSLKSSFIEASMEASINAVLETGVDHLSLYILTLSGSTPLAHLVQGGKVVLPEDDLNADCFLKASQFIVERGFNHYEVSNFASSLKGESRHNKKYWTGSPYLGLGPGAHSFDGSKKRWWNLCDADKYVNHLLNGRHPPGKEEILTSAQRRVEKLMLGLRTSRGISKNLADPKGIHALVLKEMIRNGLLIESTERFFPTERGMLKADAVASALS